ncbi:transporter [Actinosynnema pretiosum subsp. pretiosum]|uniref:PH domain-containing protein n=2 Tax=Actinosynnema TaxID=40566 RepID=C6W8Z2_ACTMD|nr:hypothetical protein [Actinosynnema mirum]ACU39064.1 hypothetical protein Amir_5243 [Actinosynnema mirum DSM 43827]AXX32658.1 Integral membrane protein related to pyrimidine synthesis [Actinosynnema pretiosum subsp. pretiosum]QUF03455.1 transporter [Actinosynnema pretiosum subsp. pretiosum]
MTRTLLALLCLAVFVLIAYGMWHGWRKRARAQEQVLAQFPAPPAEQGEPVLETTGVYVGTTIGDDWQDRVAIGDIGHRAEAVLRLTGQGVLVERDGASPLWIPAADVRGARTARGLANKVMTADGLLVVRWQLGDKVLDTGFRGDDKDVYEQWVDALNAGGKA